MFCHKTLKNLFTTHQTNLKALRNQNRQITGVTERKWKEWVRKGDKGKKKSEICRISGSPAEKKNRCGETENVSFRYEGQTSRHLLSATGWPHPSILVTGTRAYGKEPRARPIPAVSFPHSRRGDRKDSDASKLAPQNELLHHQAQTATSQLENSLGKSLLSNVGSQHEAAHANYSTF